MVIKFIGSGEAAKAILYYVTDYISKAQLKVHVAYAALELAVCKLGEYNPADDELTVQAKCVLQKCAHAMISHQELSSQQVMSYLLDFEDHFTSHEFNNLFWTTAEASINSKSPSPECYSHRPPSNENQAHVSLSEDNIESENDKPVSLTNFDISLDKTVLEADVDHDEVAISLNDNNQIIAHPSQLTDYKYHSWSLDHLTLWDFCAQTEKVKAAHDQGESESEIIEIDEVLSCSSRTRPTYKFMMPHDECHTHALKICHPHSQHVPVLVGSVPRRDQHEMYPRYCQLMLILFMPWQTVFDLRMPEELWSFAFDKFKSTLQRHEFEQIMDNVQLLHECKDSRNDHFGECPHHPFQLAPEITAQDVASLDDAIEDIDDVEILQHLESIEDCHSEWKNKTNINSLDCIEHAEVAGLFDINLADPHHMTMATHSASAQIERLDENFVDLESTWKENYDHQCQRWKQKTTACSPDGFDQNQNIFAEEMQVTTSLQALESMLPSIECQSDNSTLVTDADIKSLARKWMLNPEQRQAFRIIMEHSLQQHKHPLRMFISGPAGTGKTTVINVIKELFEQREQSR